jgi:hypothetical protein
LKSSVKREVDNRIMNNEQLIMNNENIENEKIKELIVLKNK